VGVSLPVFQWQHLQAFGDSGGSPASPPEEGRHSESSETDRYSTGYSSMDGHSGMKNPSSEFRSGNTTPSFNLGDVWDKAKKLAGRWDLPLMMSMLSQVRELRFHGVALDLHSNTTGRSLRLGRPRCTPRRATLPSWLPSEADTVCNSLCNGDASLAVRLGMSHKLLGCRLRHEVETMVGVQGPGETLPRIMGAGVNLQLPGGLRHIWIHLGASPKLKDSVSLAESLQVERLPAPVLRPSPSGLKTRSSIQQTLGLSPVAVNSKYEEAVGDMALVVLCSPATAADTKATRLVLEMRLVSNGLECLLGWISAFGVCCVWQLSMTPHAGLGGLLDSSSQDIRKPSCLFLPCSPLSMAEPLSAPWIPLCTAFPVSHMWR